MSHDGTRFVFSVIREEAGYRVLNKPTGLSVLKDNTGAPSVQDLYPTQFGESPLFVHRIDKGTSGLLLVARAEETRAEFARRFSQGGIEKTYLALVWGRPEPEEGLIELPLAPGRKGKFRVAPPGHGLPSRTEYRLLAMGEGMSLLQCRPRSGRTHQIRVHLSALGCPLVKDPLYGRERGKPSRDPELTLHAWKLAFTLPGTVETVQVEAPPPDWAEPLLNLRNA